ncbi:unnamed protein product [Hymenolepis diminuta]|uniref:Uncharacterized protein n=1 Tax=Hymenolepis diminuta TaxID=6216 RepID=A0A564Z133_HYMDI|nr:unnamed protein product [Hymenolepis diminuta]
MSIIIQRLEMIDWQQDLHYSIHRRSRRVFACMHTDVYRGVYHHAKTPTSKQD